MLKLVGAVLLILGASVLGFSAAGQLRARVESLRALTGALAQVERELSFRLTPMPELMERVARQARPPARYLFAHCRDHLWELGEKSFGQLWREAVEAEPELLLDGQERDILTELGDVLGRYDAAGQREALARASAELEGCLQKAEEERSRLGRVYAALGLGSGAMLAILLL